MKFRVVGWTAYDNPDVPEGESHDAADRAVIDEIAKRGYLFPGSDHHWHQLGAPVLNDGKMRTYSERGWGAIMAEGHGEKGRMDYAKYAFDWYVLDEEDTRVFPTAEDEFDREGFVPEQINEEIVYEVDEELFAKAQDPSVSELRFDECDELRYLGEGDTLILVCGDKRVSLAAGKVSHKRDLTSEQVLAMFSAPYKSEEEQKKIDQIYADSKEVIDVLVRR